MAGDDIRASTPAEPETIADVDGRGELGSVEALLRAAASAPPVARPPAVGDMLARYRITGVVGRGGMGIVYEALDLELDRVVALKCLPGERVGDERRQQRFVREALVTASLEHPGIVPVYDAGLTEGQLFYAMKKVSGRRFALLITEAHDTSERLALLRHVVAVSEAVAYAHRRGIIHRDLKPDNILVGELGETVIIDWGLARRVGAGGNAATTSDPSVTSPEPDAVGVTRAGDVMGTPGYMAPEQARGLPLDARADVYALGALLRQVLCGVPPGRQPPAAVMAELRERVPDLLTLVAKATAPDPRQRYGTAEELAEELRRFEAGQLVGAHQYSLPALIGRWLRRHRAVVAVAAALGALLVAVIAVSVRRVVGERDRATAAQLEAEARQRELVLVQARDSLDRDPTASLAWLRTYPHSASSLPAERAIAADAWARGVARHVVRGADAFTSVTAFADGEQVAATTAAGDLVILDAATGARRALHGDDGTSFTVQVAPDGRSAATSDARGAARVWDLAAGTSRKLDGNCVAMSLFFSPDAALVLGWNVMGGACLWDAATGTRRDLPEGTLAAAFLPDRRALALAREGRLEILDLASGELATEIAVEGRPTQVVASADGRWLGVTTADHVTLLDRRRKTQKILRAEQGSGGVRLSRDGRWAAMCGVQNGTIWAFDLDRDGPPRVLASQGCIRRGMLFAPDGTLVTMAGGAGVNLLDLAAGTERSLAARQAAVLDVDVSADGRLLASVSRDALRVYRLGEGDVRVFPGRSAPATVASNGTLLLRDAADGRLAIGKLVGEATPPISSARPLLWAQSGSISGDGHRVVVPEADGSFVVYEPASGRRTTITPYAGEPTRHITDALSIDGTKLALAGSDCAIRIVDLETGTTRVVGKHSDGPLAVAFSWDGSLLASTGRDGVLRLWDVASGAARGTYAAHGFLSDVGFSRDDTRVAAPSTDGSAWVWDVASGRSTVLAGHQTALLSADFSPDGSALVTAAVDGAVTWWDLGTQKGRILRREPADLGFVRFSIDGRLVLTGGSARVRIWDPKIPRIPDDPEGFAAWLGHVTSAEVDASGELASP